MKDWLSTYVLNLKYKDLHSIAIRLKFNRYYAYHFLLLNKLILKKRNHIKNNR